MESLKIKTWYLVLFAAIQFPIKLTSFLHYLTYVYIYLIPLIYIAFNFGKLFGKKNLLYQLFLLIYTYLFFVSIIYPIIKGTLDFSYLTTYWVSIFLWVIKYTFLVLVFIKKVMIKNPFEEFSEYFIRGAGLYSISSLLFALIKPLRFVMTKIIYLTDQDKINMLRPEYATRFGWTGWSSFNETYICTIAVILACILIYNNESWKKRKHVIKIMVLPLFGNAMFGRIGLLVSLLCLVFTFLFLVLKGNVKLFILSIFLCIVAVVVFILLKERITVLQTWSKWVFSAFTNYRQMGKFYDDMGTIEHLTHDMYWMPEKETFLSGDGRYMNSDGSYYMHTDSGVMRPMLYYGIINYSISIFAILILVRDFANKVVKWTEISKKKIIILVLLIVLIVFEFKGETLWMLLGIFVPFVNLLDYKEKNNVVRSR